jgi:NADP-reducing hydrogenase subunit HndD
VASGEATYHFIEIMGCPGGCVNGGGQPQQPGRVRNTVDIRAKRASVLYNLDANAPIRKSHENPEIKKLYDEGKVDELAKKYGIEDMICLGDK